MIWDTLTLFFLLLKYKYYQILSFIEEKWNITLKCVVMCDTTIIRISFNKKVESLSWILCLINLTI